MHTSSIQDGGKTVYWGLGSTDVDTEVSHDIIMSRQNHNSAHHPALGHNRKEDRNWRTGLVLSPSNSGNSGNSEPSIIPGSNLF